MRVNHETKEPRLRRFRFDNSAATVLSFKAAA
jgi:hypothetical protein